MKLTFKIFKFRIWHSQKPIRIKGVKKEKTLEINRGFRPKRAAQVNAFPAFPPPCI